MAKGAPKGKSSASSATRKKQANKAAIKKAYERDDDGKLLHPELAEALEKQNKQHGPQRGQKKDKTKKDGKGGKKGKAEKKKQYIPPPKPPQPLPDPLDSMGLASLLPADLVVLLRKASKKDVITRCRALEGLLAWVEDALGKSSSTSSREPDAEASNLSSSEKRDALVMMLPSWVHLFPRLALSPTRRLRLLTMQIQTLLLEKLQEPSEHTSTTRAELLESPQYIEPILGPWAILCHDTDRTIERLGRAAWNDTCSWRSSPATDASAGAENSTTLDLTEHCDILVTHLRTILLSPSPSFALSLTSAHAVASADPTLSRASSGYATPSLQPSGVERDAKNRDESNVEEDTAALDKRLVAGALAVLSSVIRQKSDSAVMESLQDIFSSRLVWASLSPHNLATSSSTARIEAAAPVTSFGFESPAVRLRAWTLLRTIFDMAPDLLDQHINTIGTVAMSSVWSERDNAVQRATLDAILPLLRKRPELWLIGSRQDAAQKAKGTHADDSDDEHDDDEDTDDDEEEDDDSSDTASDDRDHEVAGTAQESRPKPQSYTSFLQWLQSACGGAPHLGYSAVIVFISTIPAEILAHDDLDAASDLLTNFFSALYSRPLDFDPTGCRAFFASFTECVAFLALRMLRTTTSAGKDNAASANDLVRVHFGSAWSELVFPKASLLSSLGASAAAEDADEAGRVQRIKNIGSTRIVSDLAIQVRRVASSESQLVLPFVAETEADLVEITEALCTANTSDPKVLATLERAASFYAALAPSQGQTASAEIRAAAAAGLSRAIKLAASRLSDVDTEATASSDLRRTRATLLSDFLCLLLRSAVSVPDAPDGSATEVLAQTSQVSIPHLVATKCIAPTSAASFLAAYLPLCTDEKVRASIWTETLSSVALLGELQDRVDALSELFAASEAISKAAEASDAASSRLQLPAPEAGIEDLAIGLVTSLCDSAHVSNELRYRLRNLVSNIMTKPGSFIDASCVKAMLSIICSTIEHLRNTLLERPQPGEDEHLRKRLAASTTEHLLYVLEIWIKAQSSGADARRTLRNQSFAGILTAVFELAHLYKGFGDPSAEQHDWISKGHASGVRALAHHVMQHVLKDASEQEWREMQEEERAGLQDHLLDIHVPVDVLVNAAMMKASLLPERQELRDMMLNVCRQETHAALLVFDPLIPQQSSSVSASASSDSLIDGQGLGIFARICAAALLILNQDRAGAKKHVNLLPLVVLLSILIEDDLLVAGASKHALASSVLPEAHRAWLQSSVTATTALISSLSDAVTENWHNDLVTALQRSTAIDADKDGIGHVLSAVWGMASELNTPSSYLARVFHRLLNAVFSFGTVTEVGADRWLKLGDAVQDRMPAMAHAIFHAVKPIAGSSPVYDRLRNGAAAKLAGLGPNSAEDRLLKSLRTLVALAPPVDSDLAIIPQQRAMFLLKDIQRWHSDDENNDDPEEETSTRLAELFVHLLPVVQDVPGSHIDFIFDTLETNLELCSLAEDDTVAQLYHNLRLLETMRDLASRNANLRDYWKDRSVASIDRVRDQFLSLPGLESISAPKQACIDLIVDLIRETSEAPFMLSQTAAPLCKLLVQNPSHEVQVISYRLLSGAIREHIKELVVESAVDREALATEEGQQKLKLPEALVANISDSMGPQLNLLVEEGAARRTAFGYFLSWIAVFEHFEGASLSVKSAFLGEIEKRDLLVESLLPTVFALVGLADESRRPFDPSRFVLEEVFLDQIDAESSLTVLQVLAAHVYLRALIHMPTAVRGWWVNIKDRQHSMQIASFTTRHLSPIIANRELSHLREPEAMSKLQDEALSIKILSTNEVIATYVVDEHPMEIGVKIPSDFPLHGVEIRDIQRVGITEAKWRSWLLAVQQLITGQNGLIFDALSLFKRNAEVQFQGLDECAICYSIISPMDRSLPTKPCKTCKNKFHAGCLFKWISTSGASTCPLCRSIL
ncbi:predicted ubiquitin-protein ligase [Pseudozyma hubeiensis SY62]|uniref:E3 ubiquitin-protein ligase listerin n=1 Tax=Pseudozyma hubeiensis (strain SY62) TaxID=1305764 RepID=R9PDD7_PSEHS|nr:predicted ubiquitin-protein ligase [Pseudozyma hubeiensis SY62]GAC99356.1 predicted ubiquitin-protein ligase [Pseudozyma hubeiensis SY62]